MSVPEMDQHLLLDLEFIFPGRYLKADHLEMFRGRGGLKNYEC